MSSQKPLLAAADAARVLGVTPATVRLMVKRGDLRPAFSSESGIRLFRRAAVERLRDARDAKIAARYADEEARG
jgi:DNA-binding transcriptional MerR regulator